MTGVLGVCYYPEHWPRESWAEDARRMVELGIALVRIGEFAWSRLEPRRGEFHWDWLDDAVATLGDAGLEIIMCTQTATPPKWLVDERPEILAADAQERPRRFGSRRHYCFSSPAWLEETRRICALVAKRYGTHPAVVAWQLDNEYGCHDTVLSYAPHCRPAFRAWLEARYGTVENLNAAWGAAFWSQDYDGFHQVDPPNLTVTEPNPAHLLDYRRFSSDQVVAYNRLQAEIVREHAPGRPIIHNFMGFFTEFDHGKVARDLDIVSWDSYPLGFTNERMGLQTAEKARLARTGHPDAAAFNHDLYRGIAPKGRFWVMEQQPGPVNWAPYNPAPALGMVRLWTWEALAHGAEVVSYFRWRQAPFAQEQFHAGLNRPDGKLDMGGEEAARVARELGTFDLAGEPPRRARVALLYTEEADWLLRIQPQGESFRYRQLVLTFYTALRRLALDVDVVPPSSDLQGYALVVVPCLPILDEGVLEALATSGAAAVFGPRCGSRTIDHQIPEGLAPGPLQARVPIKVSRVESLPPGLEDQLLWHNRQYPIKHWRETIESELEAAARFADGGGAIYVRDDWHYLSFWPDESLLVDYLEALLGAQGIATQRLPDTLRVRHREGIGFAFNYGSRSTPTPAPPGAHFLLGGPELAPRDVAAWQTD
jgi:beta-galactosidase